MKHFPRQLCLHCYGQSIPTTFSSSKALKLDHSAKCAFCHNTNFDGRTLKERLTGLFFVGFHKRVLLHRRLKVSVFFVLFFVTAGLWVYPSPLSVAKLHTRMSYHRHICTKYAMKLCGPCTIRATCPLPPLCRLLGLHVSWTALPSRLPLISMM